MEVKINNKILKLICGDITKQETDAIVNAANNTLLGGGGVNGAIHRAGGPAILEECRKIGGCATGDAVITSAGKMKAKYVIHTVGPIWRGGKENEDAHLRSCYEKSLKLADKNNLRSISFPSISTGAYCFPVDRASSIALSTVISYLKEKTKLEEVVFVLFDTRTLETYEKSLEEILSKQINK